MWFIRSPPGAGLDSCRALWASLGVVGEVPQQHSLTLIFSFLACFWPAWQMRHGHAHALYHVQRPTRLQTWHKHALSAMVRVSITSHPICLRHTHSTLFFVQAQAGGAVTSVLAANSASMQVLHTAFLTSWTSRTRELGIVQPLAQVHAASDAAASCA